VSLRVGVKLPWRFESAGEFLADAQAYETAGADSLWVSDGMFRPIQGTRMKPGLDPWTQLAAVAGVTSRVRLGTSVAVVPQWPPAILAQTLTTLEHLSGGRLLVGVGAGWEPVQLAAGGVPFEARGRRLDEYLDVVRRIWRGEETPFEGRFYNLPGLHVAPGVRPGGPPILVGGFSEPGFRRAARLGDGFIHGGGTPEQVRVVFDRVLGLREAEGDFDLWAQVRSPAGRSEWKETLEAYAATGATGVIVGHAPNLLDILRNPDQEDDRSDLQMATG